MTVHVFPNKDVYCAIWTEIDIGYSGNDIANAVSQILEKIIQNSPKVKHIIMWSDSCVPQNNNQMMSLAMKDFLKKHPQIDDIVLKYSTAGHLCIQEVHNVHYQIEKALRASEFWSPISFMRIHLAVNRKKPLNIIQMKTMHFKDFHKSSKHLHFNKYLSLKFRN